MILISHRGNINGKIPEAENNPEYIDDTIRLGYDVEIDVRLINNNLYLGHDTPDYKIDLDWLLNRKDKLWIHAKNFDALDYLINYDLRIFFHEQEKQTIINKCDLIWSHDLTNLSKKSIIPLLDKFGALECDLYIPVVKGICSDFIDFIKQKI